MKRRFYRWHEDKMFRLYYRKRHLFDEFESALPELFTPYREQQEQRCVPEDEEI